MKKFLLASALVLTLSTAAFAATESVVSGSNNGDEFTFVAKDTLGPGAPFGVTFARLVTGPDPYFNILPGTQFDGVEMATKFASFATTSALAAIDSRVDDLEVGGSFSGDYNDLTNKPTLFSGAYADLTGKPDLSTKQDHDATLDAISDLDVSSHIMDMMETTTKADARAHLEIDSAALHPDTYFATASALSGKFDAPAGSTAQYLRGDGSLATFPSIPSAQVNADWTASSGVAQILNKPSTFAPSAHSHTVADVTGLQTALDDKAASSHTHAQSDVTNLVSDLAKKPAVYLGGTQKSGAKVIFKSATVASGNAVFYLTADETSSGTALCTNVYLDSLMMRAVEGTNPHSFGTAAMTNSNRTLTVPVSKVAPILGILNVGQDANGTVVKASIYCD